MLGKMLDIAAAVREAFARGATLAGEKTVAAVRAGQ